MIALKSPKQQIYDTLFEKCYSLQPRTFTKLPPIGTGYPFIVIGSTYKQERTANKSFITGNIQQHIHIWVEEDNKIDASTLEFEITKIARSLLHTENFNLRLDNVNSDEGVSVTDGRDLWHIDLELDYRFS